MNSTRASLLARVRDFADGAAWQEFYDRYAPVLYGYARSCGLGHADAEEVRDRCLDRLLRDLPGFVYDRSRGRFKSWLSAVARTKVADVLRLRRDRRNLDTAELLAIPDGGPSPAEAWAEQWRLQGLRVELQRARQRVSTQFWSAFELLLEGELSPGEIAGKLRMSRGQVYKAKWQVLREVRAAMARQRTEDPA
ncbi:MAG: sigma-70 family RNA polymerase sigma factor [Planctomycetota bacterium]